MITREGLPLVAKNVSVNIDWESSDPSQVNMVNALIAFDNVNQTSAGEIIKERTSLPTNPTDPIPWPEEIPEGIKSVWASPENALTDILGILYESDEHQYRLGTKTPPEEVLE